MGIINPLFCRYRRNFMDTVLIGGVSVLIFLWSGLVDSRKS